MSLRNPALTLYGISYPDNIYEIEPRTIRPQKENKTLVNVEIYLTVYSDNSKTYEFERSKPIYFVLNDLPNDPAQLNPAAYEQALQAQYPDEILDGAALSDFILI